MKLCDRCKVLGCADATTPCFGYLSVACKTARSKWCPDVQPNNAEHITNMDYNELADFLMDVSMGLLIDKKIMNVRAWLEESYEEE